MRARFRPVTMQLAKGFPSQQSRPGDTSNEPRHSPRRPWPTRRVAPAWPNWSGVKGVGPPANNTRSTGSSYSSLYLGRKFGHGHEHVLGRGHGHGQYLLLAPPVRAPSRETPPRQASVIGSTDPIPRRPRPGDGGIRGGGKDSSWSLGHGCNHLSRLVAILILSVPGQAQLVSAPTAARHLPPLKTRRARHSGHCGTWTACLAAGGT